MAVHQFSLMHQQWLFIIIFASSTFVAATSFTLEQRLEKFLCENDYVRNDYSYDLMSLSFCFYMVHLFMFTRML